MRADAQALVNRIDAALNLVENVGSLDRALRRLDQLNARVEPKLWDNPKQAEEVMRERRRLEAAVATVREIDADKTGTVELIELAEMKDDGAGRRRRRLAEGARRPGGQGQGFGAAFGRGRSARHLHRNPCRRRRHRKPGLGRNAVPHVARWAEQRGFKVDTIEYQAGDTAGIKAATIQVKGENAYGYAKPKAACTVWCAFQLYDSSARRHTSFSSV